MLCLLAACVDDFGVRPAAPQWCDCAPRPLEGDDATDTFVVGDPRDRDVLWIVDDGEVAGSLRDLLVAALPGVVRAVEDTDWRLGLVSADPAEGGHLLVRIDAGTPDPVAALEAGLGALGDEGPQHGLAALRLAAEVERDDANADFFRDDAVLDVVFVAARPDATPAGTFPDDDPLAWLAGVPSADLQASVVGDDPVLAGLAAATHGFAVPAGASRAVLEDFLKGFERRFFLSEVPVADSLEVRVVLPPHDAVVALDPGGWRYDRVTNAVELLDFGPPRDSVVTVEYVPERSLHPDPDRRR